MSLIDSYFLEYLDNEMVSLLINLRNKSTLIHRANNNTYWLSDKEEGIEHEEALIEEFPVLSRYHCFEARNKDQIHYLWVPMYQLTNVENIKNRLKEKCKIE